jgi:hypothetical protein
MACKLLACYHRRMTDQGSDDQYSDEEAARRACEAIRRSFEMPHKPQKEMVGKVGAPKSRKAKAPITSGR